MQVEFLGVSSWAPEQEQADTASCLVNRHILIDMGWHVVRNLLRTGLNPLDIDNVFFTHMHQDHYMGLAAFLFYRLNAAHTLQGLSIYGPEGVEEIVDRALLYVCHDRDYADIAKPKVRVLAAEDTVPLRDAVFTCVSSCHAVSSRSFRMTDSESGKSFAFSGDTQPFEGEVEFIKGSEILIHEASYGDTPRPSDNPVYHSSCMDAAQIAKDALVQKLYMVHMFTQGKEAALEKARGIFPVTYCPKEGETFTL